MGALMEKLNQEDLMFLKIIKLYCFLFFLTMSTPLYAHQFMNPLCSKKFVGEVDRVEAAEAPIHTLSKDTVVFKVKESIKGDVANVERVKLLKFGPVKVKEGKDYIVHLEKGSICLIQEQK
jgi:hypothetical protein